MGQIYLQVKTNNNDGVPTDQVAYVKGLTAEYFGAANHTKQGTLASIGRPETYILSPVAGSGGGGTGFKAQAIIVLNEGSDTVGKIEGIEVTARGSGYTSNPTVTFGTETFQTERGTGDPTSQPILILEDGVPKSSVVF